MKEEFLVSLIDNLSASEKRYISEYLAVRNNDNHFSALFNSVVSGKKNQVIERMKKESSNTLYVTKNKLKKKIFRLLRMYHSDMSREQALKNMCIDVEILYHKGLLADCINLIDTALEMCQKNEWFELELYILSWKEKILITSFHNADVVQIKLSEISERKISILSKLKELYYHQQFSNDVYLILAKFGILAESVEKARLKKTLNQYKSKNTSPISSFRSRIYNYRIYVYYYFILQDYTKAYPYAQKQVKEVELFQMGSKMPMPRLLGAAIQCVIICEQNLKKYAKLQISLSKIRAIDCSTKQIEAFRFASTYIIETESYRQTGQFDKIEELIPTIKQGLNSYKQFINNKELKISLYYDISCLYFGCTQYKLALEWNNKALNNYHRSVREDVYCFARILNLVIHYELGNTQLLEHLILSTYRYLYKKEEGFKIEKIILNFIRLQLKNDTALNQNNTSLEQLLSDIKQLCSTSKREKAALEYFDFISWLESKIQNRPFAEIVKEKTKTK